MERQAAPLVGRHGAWGVSGLGGDPGGWGLGLAVVGGWSVSMSVCEVVGSWGSCGVGEQVRHSWEGRASSGGCNGGDGDGV